MFALLWLILSAVHVFADLSNLQTATTLPPFPSKPALHISVLTVGSRGDVQYIIPFCMALIEKGHRCTLVTHEHFRHFVTQFGIEFAPVAGDPNELIGECVEHGLFSKAFIMKHGVGSGLRKWMDDLFDTASRAIPMDTDVLVAVPTAMVGYHIAEARNIPLVHLFPVPVSPSSLYPHPFVASPRSFGILDRAYNRFSHSLLNYGWYLGIRAQVNRWRQKLGLPLWKRYNPYRGYWADSLGMPRRVRSRKGARKEAHGVTTIYAISSAVTPVDPSWGPNIHMTGYWFLNADRVKDFTPSPALEAFMDRSHDPRPIVFIGFGSMKVKHIDKFTRNILKAIHKANVKVVLQPSWIGQEAASSVEDYFNRISCRKPSRWIRFRKTHQSCFRDLKDLIFLVDNIPHDWLFKQVDVVVHHGGAGTTATVLKAGKPQVIGTLSHH